ncbi:MAG: SAM-dependent methyltransferase, partial [Phycisphaerae bacterium]
YPQYGSPEGLGETVPWLPDWGYWSAIGLQPGRRIAFGAGLYYVQDAGSMLAIRLLAVQPGELVCDLCASPGGKATAILEALGHTGGLLVNETIRSRLAPLNINLARHGASRFIVTCMDPSELAEILPGCFDAVLVDAPCTGQSLLGRGRQRLSAFDPHHIVHCAARQRRILAAAARLVRPGGRIVYSTCTFSWQENEAQVMQFIAEHQDFDIQRDEGLITWQSPSPAPHGCYRLWPDVDRCAGAFAARLLRCRADVGAQSLQMSLPREAAKRRGRRDKLSLAWDKWGRWAAEVRIVPIGQQGAAAMPADLPAVLRQLAEAGRIISAAQGAVRYGKRWQPAYALAMRRDGAFVPSERVQLDDEQAAAYLRGEPIATSVLGWAVATWRGYPLGWVHGTGRIGTNKLRRFARLPAIE